MFFRQMGGVDQHERHVLWSREEMRSNESFVRTDDFAGAVVYPEYLTDDAIHPLWPSPVEGDGKL